MRKNNTVKINASALRALPRGRIKIVGLVFLALFVLVTIRLARFMMFSEEKVAEFAQRQKFGSMELHNPRGAIYDRNMNELALSIRMKSIFINPKKVSGSINKTARALAVGMAPGGGAETRSLARRLNIRLAGAKNRHFMWLERKAAPEVYARIKAADIDGVGFVDEYRRFYPKRDFAAKIVGFCGMDNHGLSGLEYYYDQRIQGVNAISRVRKDALGRPVDAPENMEITDAYLPYDIILTIDERIQYAAERALESKVKETGAVGGVAIVMDPHSGEILAMAEQPRFNPNNFAMYSPDHYKMRAISNPVEPGSTFKIFTTSAALEEKVLRAGEIIDCQNGQYTVGGKTFKEAHDRRFGKIPVAEVIAQSSNIGAIKIGERLGKERLDRYMRRFGFGSRTGVDLPGESAGTLRDISKWSQVSLPSISFGQEVAVTPMQLITGFSVFANGGYLVKPRLAKAFMQDGKLVKTFAAGEREKILSPSTVKTMTAMMMDVVEKGTGAKAAVEGYKVAGKTGTAQVFDAATGAYSESRYLASFIGYFPADNPALTILVMIDSPTGAAWGGHVAGPVFSEIAAKSARILRIPGAGMEVYEVDWARLADSGPGNI